MHATQSSTFREGAKYREFEKKNDRLTVGAEVQEFMRARTADRLLSIEQRIAAAQALRRSKKEKDLKRRLAAKVKAKLDIVDEISQLRQIRLERHNTLNLASLSGTDKYGWTLIPRVPPKPAPIPPGGGQMWWSQTICSYPEDEASAWWDDKDGMHVAANFPSHSDDLQKKWIDIHAYFILSNDSKVAGGQRFLSAPISQVVGQVYGYTVGSYDPWDLGDIWSKCWLNTSQTVWVYERGRGWIPIGGISVNLTSDSKQLVFLENSDEPTLTTLPGFLAMPVVVFDMPLNPLDVIVDLKWEFHVQLEGENASLLIGHTQSAASCVINHPQWNIQPI
jgi:hypothetical protein